VTAKKRSIVSTPGAQWISFDVLAPEARRISAGGFSPPHRLDHRQGRGKTNALFHIAVGKPINVAGYVPLIRGVE
jgi:hypothetical protein